MNPDLERLQPYPFEKLHRLFADVTPNPELPAISLGIGEPQHPAPDFVVDTLTENLNLLAKYPATRGLPELRAAIARWLERRFQLSRVDEDSQVLPVAGTREALFGFGQAVIDRSRKPLVLAPNPFYQIYEGASLLAGAELGLLDCRPEHGFIPDFSAVSEADWQRCQLLFICTPGNPTGAVLPLSVLRELVELAQRHDFVIASDECYSEIYANEDEPPPGLLEACRSLGLDDYRRCVVFHSLSKRSNLPGLRSGFVAGDEKILQDFLRYRTYQGCAMPVQHQWASIAAWSDEEHVRHNRVLYRQKFATVIDILGDSLPVGNPVASFYLWPQTPITDTEFSRELYRREHLTVLPGSYLGRDTAQGNPGAGHVRMALVAELAQCEEAAQRIRRFCESL